jgi:hypothetical protein
VATAGKAVALGAPAHRPRLLDRVTAWLLPNAGSGDDIDLRMETRDDLGRPLVDDG